MESTSEVLLICESQGDASKNIVIKIVIKAKFNNLKQMRSGLASEHHKINLKLVALTFDNSVMCTAEIRKEGMRCIGRLKFWERGRQNNEFKLSQVIDRPP
ncbi:hypothetical protein L1987_69557 [Smallanthus sonchifolius]|uniref:Uncharacterized protein n=1 Tax=Smallanthus sonchifolius TaxID=185202 RepID=A0ACB9B5V9_9ASTR|nr:hypothetical protein L1987_69557 [Smallanthus sonchifolius]